MRYEDGPFLERGTRIGAPPQHVWELVTDIGLPARLSPELLAATWLDGATGPVLGARFEGRNSNRFMGEWRTVCHVVALDAPHVFSWAVTDPDGRFGGPAPDPAAPMALWSFTLDAAPGGGTALRHSARLGPARSGLSTAIDRDPSREEEFVAYRLHELGDAVEATLRGVKERAEAACASATRAGTA